MMLRSPVSRGSIAALTPSSSGSAEVKTLPEDGGSSPATARSRVDFPEPLVPRMPIDSP
jgi:hypothetical protein